MTHFTTQGSTHYTTYLVRAELVHKMMHVDEEQLKVIDSLQPLAKG